MFRPTKILFKERCSGEKYSWLECFIAIQLPVVEIVDISKQSIDSRTSNLGSKPCAKINTTFTIHKHLVRVYHITQLSINPVHIYFICMKGFVIETGTQYRACTHTHKQKQAYNQAAASRYSESSEAFLVINPLLTKDHRQLLTSEPLRNL